MTSRALLAATAAAVLTLAGCAGNGTDSTTATETSPGAVMSETTTGGTLTTATGQDSEHSAADVMFSRMMIPHHQQAIEMSDIILDKDDVPADVRTMAEEIKAAQGPEIEQMRQWLEQWGVPGGPQGGPMMGDDVPGHMGDHMGGADDAAGMPMMDGMLSGQEMRELSDARGPDAARLFLEQMIAHHEGAIEMAQDEVSDGTYPPTVELARSIIQTQQREIDRMREMIAAL